MANLADRRPAGVVTVPSASFDFVGVLIALWGWAFFFLPSELLLWKLTAPNTTRKPKIAACIGYAMRIKKGNTRNGWAHAQSWLRGLSPEHQTWVTSRVHTNTDYVRVAPSKQKIVNRHYSPQWLEETCTRLEYPLAVKMLSKGMRRLRGPPLLAQ